jgi:hypothetical protein
MLLLLLTGCGTPLYGTWMFTTHMTLPTGDECTRSLSHNFIGAYEPVTADTDTGWVETDTGEESAEVSFGRIEKTATGAVMVLGTASLPGTQQDDGSWLFYWTNSTSGNLTDTHVSGYVFSHNYDSSSTLRISGTLEKGTFTGVYETEQANVDTWDEYDVWSEEAAVYVGEHGEIPSGDYLNRIDSTGTEVAATNGRQDYDCGASGCTLTVSATCAYRYDFDGVATDFSPDDARWVQDAGQVAGNQ